MRRFFGTILFGRIARCLVGVFFIAAILDGCSETLNPTGRRVTVIPLPGSQGTISLDDMLYDATIGRLVVPAAETGNLDLIDPVTLGITTITGFSMATQDFDGNPGQGSTSVAAGQGLLFATDNSMLRINVVDPTSALKSPSSSTATINSWSTSGAIIAYTSVMTTPDYVRYVALTHELWVTEKALGQIEIFSVPDERIPTPVHVAVIPIPNGPETLLIDETSGHAYTNQPKIGMTAVIDIKTRAIVAQWGNGCSKARGMALDRQRGFLFVACNEGKVVMLDANNNGLYMTNEAFGGSIDFVSYNPQLAHLYLPSSKSALLAIFAVAVDTPTPTPEPSGSDTPEPAATATLSTTSTMEDAIATPTPVQKESLILVGTIDTAPKAKCVVADDRGNAWVCDPLHAQLLLIRDDFPPGAP